MILINSFEKDVLGIFQPFLPIAVPVGIGSLMAVAEESKINASHVDQQVEEDDALMQSIEEYVKKSKPPCIFGFSVLTAALESSIVLSKKLKKTYPDSIILFGGIHPTANPEEILSFEHIDVVLRGEGEKILPELYYCLKNRKSISHIKSISYRSNGKIIHNESAPIIHDIENLPKFPYHIFAGNKRYSLGFVLSSRGCPYNCIFCSNRVTTKRRYRYLSAKKVVDDIELLYKKYNQTTIQFSDDNFLVTKERVYGLIDEIKRRQLHKKVNFTFQARGDNVDEKILRDLYDAGFRSVFFGIEAASDRLLKILKKGETLKQITDAVKMSKRIGYHVSATFLFGLPTETHRDRMACLELSKKLNLDQVRFNNVTPYPGTELYDIAKKEKRLNVQGMYKNFVSVSTFIENPFKKIPFTYVPEGSTENEIRNDLLFSYLAFYLRFSILSKIFTHPELGSSWFSAGGKLAEFIKKIPSIAILFSVLSIKFIELMLNVLLQRNTSISRKEFIKTLLS